MEEFVGQAPQFQELQGGQAKQTPVFSTGRAHDNHGDTFKRPRVGTRVKNLYKLGYVVSWLVRVDFAGHERPATGAADALQKYSLLRSHSPLAAFHLHAEQAPFITG